MGRRGTQLGWLVFVVIVLGITAATVGWWRRGDRDGTRSAPLAPAGTSTVSARPVELEAPSLAADPSNRGARVEGERRSGAGFEDSVPVVGDRARDHATLTVTLRVADTDALLVDAFVTLVAPTSDGSVREISRDRSDSSGQVRLWCECRSDLRLMVTPNDALPVTGMPVTLPISIADCRDREMDVRVPAFDAYEFHGRVLDAVSSRPIAGLVIAGPPTMVVPISAVSDANGRFTLRIRHVSQSTVVSMGAPTHGGVDVPLDRSHPDEARAALILLRPAATVRGVVLDAGGKPASGAWVEFDSALPPDAADAGRRASGGAFATGDDGRFTATSLVPGIPFDVSASGRGMAVGRRIEGLVLAPGEVRDVELRLPATHVVRGRVLDETGRPVAYAPVSVRETVARPWVVWVDDGALLKQVDSLADGTFVIEDVPSGRFWIEAETPYDATFDDPRDDVSADGVSRQVLEVPDLAGEVVVEVRLAPRERIDGFVRDEDGAGVADSVVFLRFASGGGTRGTTTDSDGRFEFEGLAKGTYVAYAAESGSTETPETSVESGARGVVLTLPIGGTVVGAVVDVGGEPVVSVDEYHAPFVRFRRASGDSNHEVELDGTFTARHVPAGEWELRAEADGQASEWKRVSVRRSETLDVGKIRLERTGRIHFVWPVTTGASTSSVRVDVRREDARVGFLTLPVGRDAMLDVPAGRLSLRVDSGAGMHEVATVTLEPGTETVVRLTLP